MNRIDTAIPGVYILEPKVFGDDRGYFLETYNREIFAGLGITTTFVQDNHSRSSNNVLRGLHYQLGRPQAKLVRVTTGEVFDVAVDVRRGSPTFGKWVGARLSAENKRMMYIPEGFAHGFYVMTEIADFQYKCSDFYVPAEDRGLLYNDPAFEIAWPIPAGVAPTLSDKDRRHPTIETAPEGHLPAFQ
ncbi:MAG: dTDP-4-dehydrorhamnose 3,5-epimerase [Deltaproteobacteria bacterium]|nr:dTDP-4-dehydrorhamnose 3,5-epimerase [Deltaproteobacteria bacterium]